MTEFPRSPSTDWLLTIWVFFLLIMLFKKLVNTRFCKWRNHIPKIDKSWYGFYISTSWVHFKIWFCHSHRAARITLPSFYWLKLIWVGFFTRACLLSEIYLLVPRPSKLCCQNIFFCKKSAFLGKNSTLKAIVWELC